MSELYEARLVCKTLPRLQSGVQQWRARSNYRKKWRDLIASIVEKEGLKPPEPLTLVRIECFRFTNHRCDYDNLVISFKPLLDGLIDAGVLVDDNMDVIVERHYDRLPAVKQRRRIEIVIREIVTGGDVG